MATRRALAWILASVFVLALVGCGSSGEEDLSDLEFEATRPVEAQVSDEAACRKCGAGSEEDLSRRERKATRLVEARVSDEVACRDNGAVNTKLRPQYPVGYSCFDKDGDFYAAVVSADGELMSLRGPVRLKPPGS